MEQITCRLPGGYIDSVGNIHRETELKPLTGREEELLATQVRQPSAALVTTILSHCVHRIGTISPVTEAIARALLVGDRQYLLLKLRELTFGDQVQATLSCPWPDCGKRVDIDFQISEIPVKSVEIKSPSYEMKLSSETLVSTEEGVSPRIVRFRLPNGEDQEMLSPLLAQNEAEALTQLLYRCVHSFDDNEELSIEFIRNLSPRTRMEIETQMEALAPGIDLMMEISCPECGRDFTVPFELQDFFFGELRTSLDLLRREVHYLAFHYHWSENEIMSMTREKRRGYIETLADEIERLNNISNF